MKDGTALQQVYRCVKFESKNGFQWSCYYYELAFKREKCGIVAFNK